MKNGEKESFDVKDVSAYLGEIEKWRDDLCDIATGALQMQGIEEKERYNLQRALDLLRTKTSSGSATGAIDELVKIIGEIPYAHAQAHALGQLWGAIGAAFIIGSRGIENPLTQKILKDERAKSTAQARSAKPSTKHRDQINEVVARHCAALWDKNPKRAGNNLGTARDILEGVNSELAKSRIKPLGKDGLCKRIVLP